ncbi:zinc finger domain-containing protein [Amycolatopsis thermoflava]|uniref:zinc finger domain-containing protein n=1 Tax=Amycolatopsis thermoflava TaxID=84480 RepID=UPI003F4A5015
MTGPRRGQYPAALFWNATTAEQDQAEARDNPRLRPCPWPPCRAAAGQPCTTTIARGRRKPLRGYHEARTTPIEETTT